MRGLILLLVGATALLAQGEKIRVIAFGAHPDDCDIRASGTAALFAAAGHAVKFVSVTNGDVGHQTLHGASHAGARAPPAPRDPPARRSEAWRNGSGRGSDARPGAGVFLEAGA